MKRTICLILSIILIFSANCIFSSCNQKITKEPSTVSPSTTVLNSVSTTDYSQTQLPTNSENDIGGAVITVQKYRAAFYSVPAPFVDLIDRSVYFEWEETIDITTSAETMVMSQFVQHFGITREQFDKANLEWAIIVEDMLCGKPCICPKDYANQEHDEIFNADIIFTFDDDLIREYYLSPDYPYIYDIEFETAVENGTYTSQTEVWVDVEAMEAEIIEKYGETEIVTEDTTEIQE